jgi:hypothetical protein
MPQYFLAYFFPPRSSRRDPDTPDTESPASEGAGLSPLTGVESISSASSIASPDTKHAPIGLSDPRYVGQRRQMLDYVNRLRATG